MGEHMSYLDKFIDLRKIQGVSGLFCAMGSFGFIESDAEYVCNQQENKRVYTYEKDGVKLCAEFTEYENGAIARRDYLENKSKKTVEVYKIVSRFRVDGNDYEAYTQYNAWEHESTGTWQKLVTQVKTASQGMRVCDGAAPILGLHNLHTGKNAVFHLMANCQWEMTARKAPIWHNRETVVVEIGPNQDGLHIALKEGEKWELPTVIFYQADNKTDLDAYKLHEVYNELHPRKRMPVIYNSWLHCFDNLNVDELLVQVDTAAELGVEMFMIDAGWFGRNEGWGEQVGDWEENLAYGPKGRLIEISQRVREKGMTFGLWFEPERAGTLCESAKRHPEYYIGGRFFDFSNPDARAYMLEVISTQIEKYQIGWLKFDFNDTMPYDGTGNAFYRYLEGQKEFIAALREKYPDIYLTNCASGGYRMELGQGSFSDSFWLSDNQGPYEGLTIVKNTLKRLPTGLIERWLVCKAFDGFPAYGHKEPIQRMIFCNNATWDQVLNVKDGYAAAFMTGGPMGFSCDLTAFPPEYKTFWKEIITQYKKDREFYLRASARILIDSDDIVAIEYADKNFDRCVVQIFTKVTYATDLTIYPVVNENATYAYGEKTVSGKEVKSFGIWVESLQNNDCITLDLKKIG